MTKSEAITKVLDLARAEIGYHEKASNSQLDDKMANKGANNYTKYARDLDAVTNFYNGAKNGFAYCDVFHDWLHYKAWGAELAMKVLCQPERSTGAGCLYSAQFYKSAGRWYTTNPQAGDQIFFYAGGDINHTGIVESVSGNTVTTIEGNTSNKVARCQYNIGSSYIAGYGRPRYELVGDADISYVQPETSKDSMKYSHTNHPLVCMMTQSTCYRSATTMDVVGVLWHCTGANNPWLKRYVQPDDDARSRDVLLEKLGVNEYRNDWNHITIQAGLNAWIGKLADGTVTTVQTMPYNYRPWGCGSGGRGSCNNGWVQFEICEDALDDADYFNAVYKEACEFTAYICREYNINPLGTVPYAGMYVPTILCHQDSFKLGLGTNHGDVYNWFNRFGKTMDDVREDVARLLTGENVFVGENNTPTVSANPTLRMGDYNDKVKELQQKLTYLGYDAGIIDGDFGRNTLSAVNQFQLQYGLEVDGVVGPLTWAALNEAVEKNETSIVPPKTPEEETGIKVGDIVAITPGAKYYTGKAIPGWVTSLKWVVASISGDRVVINESADGKHKINSPVNAVYLHVVSSAPAPSQGTQQVPEQGSKEIAVGDIVNFVGSKHYISANSKLGLPCKAGKAKVNKIYKLGSAAHPYHLVAVAGGGATVHGWVDVEAVQKV